MSFVPEAELEKLRSLVDIVQLIGEKIPLKKSGHNFKGLCPFHAEKTPSFMVHPEKQIYHCFGCGEGGDSFSFLMKYEGIGFPEAIERLAEKYGLVLSGKGSEDEKEIRIKRAEKDLLLKVNRLAMKFFHEGLKDGVRGKKGMDYLEKRGIRSTMIEETLLGYASRNGKDLSRWFVEKKVPMDLTLKLGLVCRGDAGDYYDFFRDRLIFGVVSAEGKVLGFSGRALDDQGQPKYLNSPESEIYRKGDSLLGLARARQPIRNLDQVILVEGNFDLLRLHQEGIDNTVAPLGTSLTEGQVRALARWTQNFVLVFDGDEAGFRAANRSLEIFLPLGLVPRVVLLPQGEDPDSFVKKEGAEALRLLISKAPSLLDCQIDTLLKEEGERPEGQARAVRRIRDLLALLPGEIEKRLHFQRVAQITGLPERLFSSQTLIHKKPLKKDSNLSGGTYDEQERDLSPIERTVLEVLLSGHVDPKLLFKEIDRGDFSDGEMGMIWGLLKRDFLENGAIDITRILNVPAVLSPENSGVRRLITKLTMKEGYWKEEGSQAAADCVRQFRTTRLKERLRDLSSKIRRAELEQDRETMKGLLDQKSRLIKEISAFH